MTCCSKLLREAMEDLVRERQLWAAQQSHGSEVQQQGRQGQWPHWQEVQSHSSVSVTRFVQHITGQVQSDESGLRSSLEAKTASQGLYHWYILDTVVLPCSSGRDQGQEGKRLILQASLERREVTHDQGFLQFWFKTGQLHYRSAWRPSSQTPISWGKTDSIPPQIFASRWLHI